MKGRQCRIWWPGGYRLARIYKAFGSKEQLFREAIADYEQREGGFADRAFAAGNSVRQAIETLLMDAVHLYCQPDLPQGCMVVASAASVSADNDDIKTWLAQHRLQRTQQIIDRLRQAVQSGELPATIDADGLGDYFAAFCTACRFRLATALRNRDCWRRLTWR